MADWTKNILASACLCLFASAAASQQPTPAEFREWKRNGPAYEWLCKPKSKNPIMLFSVIGGDAAQAIIFETEFPEAAAYDRKKSVWYKINSYNPRRVGWVRAKDFNCRSEHMDG